MADDKDLKVTTSKVDGSSKEVRKLNKEAKRNFIEENDYDEIDPSRFTNEFSKIIQNFDPATQDVWVLHCPKTIDINALADKHIKLPGRRYVGDLKVRATPYALPQTQAIGYVNKKGKYATQLLPLAGQLVIGKRLNQHQPNPDENTNQAPKSSKPQIFKATVRHPFFGREYKRHIELDEKVQKKLRSAHKKFTKASTKALGAENFYQIRSKLMATTQTLEQKEHDVRQSVLTGKTPKFMKENEKVSYVNLLSDDEIKNEPTEVVSVVEQPPKKKSKKSKSHGHT